LNRSKIAIFTHYYPFPVVRGDQLIVFNRLKYLSKFNEVTCYYWTQVGADLKSDDALENVKFIKVGRGWHQFWKSVFYILFKDAPLQSLGLFTILSEYEISNFDHVIAYTVKFVWLLDFLPKEKLIFELIDCLSSSFSSRSSVSKYFLTKKIYLIESKRLKIAEDLVTSSGVGCSAVSSRDQEILGKNVFVSPNGVECRAVGISSVGIISFIGNMTYLPNVDAINFFIPCFQIIKEKYPFLKLYIVGYGASRLDRSIVKEPGVCVFDNVPSVTTYLHKSLFSIAPMRVANGVQNKILEAGACGVPIICSTAAACGVKSNIKRHLNIAHDDSIESFSELCSIYIDSPELAFIQGSNLRNAICKSISWDTVNIEFYNEFLNKNND
jgi:polysaccharide biosynthesis protein PslH